MAPEIGIIKYDPKSTESNTQWVSVSEGEIGGVHDERNVAQGFIFTHPSDGPCCLRVFDAKDIPGKSYDISVAPDEVYRGVTENDATVLVVHGDPLSPEEIQAVLQEVQTHKKIHALQLDIYGVSGDSNEESRLIRSLFIHYKDDPARLFYALKTVHEMFSKSTQSA